MAKINLYGREVDVQPVWFLMQGYCDGTAKHGTEEAEKGTYTPDSFVEWMGEHVKTCEQCRCANDMKDAIVTFLKEKHSDRVVEWQQGLLKDQAIIKEWLLWVMAYRRGVFAWFLANQQWFAKHTAEYERVYGRTNGA